MPISVFELFSIGIGPSSSHTVGPMRAAGRFLVWLRESGNFERTAGVKIELYGSLGATGKGHGTAKALIGGLHGWDPETADPDQIVKLVEQVDSEKSLALGGSAPIKFDPAKDVQYLRKSLPFHANGMIFRARDSAGELIGEKTYFSVGGGFVVTGEGAEGLENQLPKPTPPYAFSSGGELLELTHKHGLSISKLTLENEKTWRSESEIRQRAEQIWQAMQDCVTRGCSSEGVLPGGLNVKRRAALLFRQLQAETSDHDQTLSRLDWVNLWALAVNEENAAGGRVVTAPTNGAAGIIPSVLHYYERFCPNSSIDGVIRFLLTAGSIGILFKLNASISGAEVGCQGEVGSACSMAAAGLTEVLGGTPEQVENAAEIAMEHNLGLTCDPIGGLVQVPCIERNAMASVKAINAARLALRGDGKHFVSLDKVIRTMRQTGADMKSKYKETARGGLAVNIIEC